MSTDSELEHLRNIATPEGRKAVEADLASHFVSGGTEIVDEEKLTLHGAGPGQTAPPAHPSELEQELEGMASRHAGLGAGGEYIRAVASTELEYASEEMDGS